MLSLARLVSISHTHTATTPQPDITPGTLAMPELEEGLVHLPNTTPHIQQLDLKDACNITDAVLKVGCRAHRHGLGCVGEGCGRSEHVRRVEGVGCTYFCRFMPVCPCAHKGRTGWPVSGPGASA